LQVRLLLSAALLACSAGSASAGRYDRSDADLAKRPVIVVASWSGKPGDFIDEYRLKRRDPRSTLFIERVVAGSAPLGPLQVKFAYGLTIGGDGSIGGSDGSMWSDVEDGRAPALWFLSLETNKTKKGVVTDGIVDHVRCVQPLVLEPWFEALRAEDRDAAVGALLVPTAAPEVVEKALMYVAGERPWPLADERSVGSLSSPPDYRPEDEFPKCPKLLPRVEALLADARAPRRPLAAAVCALLVEEKDRPKIRAMLQDVDVSVRDVTIAFLATWKDEKALPELAAAARGVHDPKLGYEAADRLAKWDDVRTVPALIQYLESDGCAGLRGDDWFMPALCAKRALRKLVGAAFPTDVDASAAAWMQAAEAEPTAREAMLRELLGDVDAALSARLEKDKQSKTGWNLAVTNRSAGEVRLPRKPQGVAYVRGAGRGQCRQPESGTEGAEAFARLGAGETHRFEFEPPKLLFPLQVPPDARLTLAYLRTGREFGLHAWIGLLNVEVAD
jgi:hypothetical protein